jgi:hypothetical protein
MGAEDPLGPRIVHGTQAAMVPGSWWRLAAGRRRSGARCLVPPLRRWRIRTLPGVCARLARGALGRVLQRSRAFLRALAEQQLLELREADAGLEQSALKPYQGAQQRHEAFLVGASEAPVLRLLDQALELRFFDLDRRRRTHRHSCARKSLASGYTHTVLIGTCARR